MALHPVGPLPASTYWRRRLVLLLGIVLVVLLVRSLLPDGVPGGQRGVPRRCGHGLRIVGRRAP
jgi:hypothetical protein